MSERLRIVVVRDRENNYTADAPSLPGSPLCGRGISPLAALGCWLVNNQERVGVEVASSETSERPPLGLRPRFVVAEQRSSEIVAAMARYAAAHEPIPLEWVEELRELAEWSQRHRPSYEGDALKGVFGAS